MSGDRWYIDVSNNSAGSEFDELILARNELPAVQVVEQDHGEDGCALVAVNEGVVVGD